MRTGCFALALLAPLLLFTLSALGAEPVMIMLDGEYLTCDVAPVVMHDRTLVPVRAVSESLGAAVAWDEETKTVTVAAQTGDIVLTVDSDTALVAGAPVTLDVPAQIVEGRAMVPLRFVGEGLGIQVDFYKNTVILLSDPSARILDSKNLIDGIAPEPAEEAALSGEKGPATFEEAVGRVQNDRYENEFYGVTMDTPKGWVSFTTDELAEYTYYLNGSPSGGLYVDSAGNPVILPAMIATRHEPSAEVTENASIGLVFYSKDFIGQIDADYEYISYLSAMPADAKIVKAASETRGVVSLNGVDFLAVKGAYKLDGAGQTFHMARYMLDMGDAVLCAEVIYCSDEDEEALLKSIASLKVGKQE